MDFARDVSSNSTLRLLAICSALALSDCLIVAVD